GQRRKTLRAALAGWAGSPALAEIALREAGIDPSARGETLDVEQFARIAEQRPHQDLPAEIQPLPTKARRPPRADYKLDRRSDIHLDPEPDL
ncbi:MAG TPA: hypothetical protein VN683_04615, partial [Acidothermaceae bacterium]|nr:hypothetical protein [Acidothermaceae bacterium]